MTIKPIRVNDEIRSRLWAQASNLIVVPETDAEEAAYRIAEPLVRMTVEKKYPPKDMKILQKYDVGGIDDCIKLQLTENGVHMFNFHKGTGPLVAEKTTMGVIYQADVDTTAAVLAWVTANEATKKAKLRLEQAYRALIQNARTLEEIIEVWPEAAEASEYAHSRALTVLTPETIAMIKADVARRTKSN